MMLSIMRRHLFCGNTVQFHVVMLLHYTII